MFLLEFQIMKIKIFLHAVIVAQKVIKGRKLIVVLQKKNKQFLFIFGIKMEGKRPYGFVEERKGAVML